MGNLFASAQSVFVLALVAVLSYLIINGLTTGSVWVKGARGWAVDLQTWAHKRSRAEEPISYWSALLFYSAGLVLLAYLNLQEGLSSTG